MADTDYKSDYTGEQVDKATGKALAAIKEVTIAGVTSERITVPYGAITGTLSNQTDLQNALNAKQDTLTAGSNIQISNNTISATDTTYTAGTGISIVNNVISNTQTSAEWGNIQGDIEDQEDLQTALNNCQQLVFSKYAITTYTSTNKYIKLATFTVENTGNYDFSNLFWVEACGPSTSKNYALVKLSARWGSSGYGSTTFEIVQKYGDNTDCFNTLIWAYNYATGGNLTGEIWLEIRAYSNWTYYFRPTQCNEYGASSITTVTKDSSPYTYYNLTGTSVEIADTEITSGYIQVVVTDNSLATKKQDTLVSGTNIKTINSTSLLGSGNIDIQATPDDVSINLNSDDELQAVGVINVNNTSSAVKTWTGTLQQYEEIGTYYAYKYSTTTVYVRKQTPTTSDTVYSAVGTASALTITAVGTSTITLSDGNTYEKRSASDTVDATQYNSNILYDISDDMTGGSSVYTKAEVDSLMASKMYHPPLFHAMWMDHTIGNMSWLRADTFSWQSGVSYANAYNHLVSDISGITAETETIGSYTVTFYRATDGHKICLVDQETTVSNIYIESGIAWYYILDTTNTQFKLPRTKWGFEGLRDTVGNKIDESLPNITGTFAYDGSYAQGTGAFLKDTSTTVTGSAAAAGTDTLMSFDASRSSSTYQNNAPVQERATQMYLYFYVGEYTQSAIEQTAGLNAELFNGKVDLNASNLSSAGESLISGLSMPSSRYIDLTLGSSGTTYTAPANGWFYINGALTAVGYLNLYNTTSGFVSVWQRSFSSGNISVATNIPVRKGDVVGLGYSVSLTSSSAFRFYYAEGET